MIRRATLFTAVLVVLAACSSVDPAAVVDESVDPLIATPLPSSEIVGTSVADVALPDVSRDGALFPMVAPAGEILVVYFGYTFCPDICPTTLADLRAALATLGDEADRVEVAMVTIDPGRDVDDVFQPFLQYFVTEGHPLRTTDPALLAAAGDAFGADFAVIEGADGSVVVTHTAYLYAVDDAGIIRRVWAFGAEPDRIATDLTALLAE